MICLCNRGDLGFEQSQFFCSLNSVLPPVDVEFAADALDPHHACLGC